MSGPIVRKYGFPNFEQIFGSREVEHGVEEGGEAPEAKEPETARAETAESQTGSCQTAWGAPEGEAAERNAGRQDA
jgi:hypothetical protein